MAYQLTKLFSPEDWDAYNAIRKAELFPDRDYNPNHPDEHLPDNHPLLLTFNNTPIATVRLDFKGGNAIIRLLAVTKSEQGKNHGTNLYRHIETYATQKGAAKLLVNSAPGAVGFYRKIGFAEQIWDEEELQGIAEDCVQMVKIL